MAFDDVGIEGDQVLGLLPEPFLGGGKLQNLGDVAQVTSLKQKTEFQYIL